MFGGSKDVKILLKRCVDDTEISIVILSVQDI